MHTTSHTRAYTQTLKHTHACTHRHKQRNTHAQTHTYTHRHTQAQTHTRSNTQVDPVKGNVAFSSAFSGWSFTLRSFAQLYADVFDADFDPRCVPLVQMHCSSRCTVAADARAVVFHKSMIQAAVGPHAAV
jgi:hypothetical protein